MAIDFSTNTSEFWRVTFERYITGGGQLGTVIETAGIEQHYKLCLPKEDFPDKSLVKEGNEWIITATHEGAGARFELRANQITKEWSFQWLD